jgi:hypothetical protein
VGKDRRDPGREKEASQIRGTRELEVEEKRKAQSKQKLEEG